MEQAGHSALHSLQSHLTSTSVITPVVLLLDLLEGVVVEEVEEVEVAVMSEVVV